MNTLREALERIATQGCNGERATGTACGSCASCIARLALTAAPPRRWACLYCCDRAGVTDKPSEFHIAHAVGEACPARLQRALDVVRFLHGEASLDGKWFGEVDNETTTGGKYLRRYWWRNHLREVTDALAVALAASPSEQTREPDALRERVARLWCEIDWNDSEAFDLLIGGDSARDEYRASADRVLNLVRSESHAGPADVHTGERSALIEQLNDAAASLEPIGMHFSARDDDKRMGAIWRVVGTITAVARSLRSASPSGPLASGVDALVDDSGAGRLEQGAESVRSTSTACPRCGVPADKLTESPGYGPPAVCLECDHMRYTQAAG